MANEPEKQTVGPERNLDSIAESARQQSERLRDTLELDGERPAASNEKVAEQARHEALETAISVEHGGAEKHSDEASSPSTSRRGPISKKRREASFKQTMEEVQEKMTPSSRAFSKIIHAKPVEDASEIVGKTIARPNAILSGAVFAFVFTLAIYLVAKNYGYPLSGFESIGAFILGWVIGILLDYFKVMFTGKK